MKHIKLPRLVVVCIMVFFVVIVSSFYVFSLYITDIATETSIVRLSSNVGSNITSVVTTYNKDVVFLESTAATISASGKLDGDSIVELLTPLTRYTSFRRLAVDLPNGESYTSDGYEVDVSQMEYLSDALKRPSLMTPITYALVEQDRCVGIVVPITRSGSVVGAVRGIYNADNLMDTAAINTFDGVGSFSLIDSNGNHISRGSTNTTLGNDSSIFISMQSLDFAEGYTLDKIRGDMMNHLSGYTVYRNGKQTICSYYSPMGIDGWYAMSSMPESHMGTEKHDIVNAAKLLLCVPLLLFVLVLLLIELRSRQDHRKLEQEQEHLRNILDNIPLPLFITNTDKKLQFVNHAAQEIFARDRNTLLGKPCYILGSSHCATPNCPIDLLMQSKVPTTSMVHQGRTYNTTSAALANGEGFIQALQDITELMEVQNSLETLASELKVNEEMYRIAASNSQNIITDYNIHTKTLKQHAKVSSSGGAPTVIENACETIIDYGLIAPDYIERYREMFRQIDNGYPTASCVVLNQSPDGTKVWNRITFTSVFGSDGRPTRSIGITEDITAEQEERFKYERESRFRNVTKQDSMLNYEIDITHHKFISGHEDMVYAIIGKIIYDYDEVCGLLVDNLVYSDDRDMVALQLSYKHLIYLHHNDINRFSFEYRRNPSGSDKPMWTEGIFYIFDDENDGTIYGYGTIRDISEQKQRELALKHKAERDLLTGLYNKITTETLIHEHLEAAGTGALMIIDLDNFKAINDTFGHALGDAVLSETARHLTELFATNSIVGRIGGDEFAVFLLNCNDVELISERANATCAMFRSSYTGLPQRKLSGTVGVALSPMHGNSFEELYRNADIALYNAKALGKDTYSIYNDGLTQIALQTTREDAIDVNSGKVFSDNITEYVLRILYESSDTDLTVSAVLELLCRYYHFSRSYVYELNEDSQRWVNTYEWCNAGIITQHGNLRQLAATPEFIELFDADGIYQMCSLDEVKPPLNRTELAECGVQSMIHFAIYQHGKLCAYIGFDDCDKAGVIDTESISVLRYTATLLGNFLLGRGGGNSDVEMSTQEMEKVLDSINNFIYVINKDNYQLHYVNARTRSLIPETANGGLCYRLLRGKDAPCNDCPIVGFNASGSSKFVSRIYNEVYGLWVDVTISSIHWRGDQRCVLLNCNDVDE